MLTKFKRLINLQIKPRVSDEKISGGESSGTTSQTLPPQSSMFHQITPSQPLALKHNREVAELEDLGGNVQQLFRHF